VAAGGQVQYRKSPMPKAQKDTVRFDAPNALIIRSAMSYDIGHQPNFVSVDFAVVANRTYDPAHRLGFL
jgi:hypothetical protein